MYLSLQKETLKFYNTAYSAKDPAVLLNLVGLLRQYQPSPASDQIPIYIPMLDDADLIDVQWIDFDDLWDDKYNGKVIGFRYEGKEFPAVPVWAFYNYIYMLALKENEKISKHLLSFSAFSDIEFSIDSFNCQACAAAQYVSLYNQNKLEKALLDFETFLKTCALEAYNYEEV